MVNMLKLEEIGLKNKLKQNVKLLVVSFGM
jgi:hypothetical protein